MPEYTKPGPIRFLNGGMCTSCTPDAIPQNKYPLLINVADYLASAITARLPQSAPIITPSTSPVHSLRRMNDNTGTLTQQAFGPASPTVAADVPVGGGTAWNNPGNILVPDGIYSTVTLASSGTSTSVSSNPTSATQTLTAGETTNQQAWSNPSLIVGSTPGNITSVKSRTISAGHGNFFQFTLSQTLVLTGFNFNIPTGATILGITATIIRSTNASAAIAQDQLVNLLRAGTIVGNNKANATNYTTTPTSATYGSASDLWGTTWTPADVNNPNFGIAFATNGNENGIIPFQITVTSPIQISIQYSLPVTAFGSDNLEATGFGFSIPGGYTIGGILVEPLGFVSSGNANFKFIAQLLKGGALVGVQRFISPTTGPPAKYLPVGNQSDLWGTTWAPADINGANFGVALSAVLTTGTVTFSVDYVRVTIYAFSSSPPSGFVLVSGSADKVFVGVVQVQSGMSQNRLSMVPFRPNNSVRPWMYIGDSAKMIKVQSDNTTFKQGIKEPQAVPTLATSGAGPLTGTIFYAYSYRSSLTGAQSNLSPTGAGNSIVAASNNIQVTCTASTDPQADLIDIWRQDPGLLNFTYIATIQNSSPVYVDSLSDVVVANNQQATFDNFEPFPSIDTPKTGTATITAGPFTGTVTVTQASGATFNVNWLPGTIVTLSSASGSTTVTLFARPTSTTVFVGLIQPPGGTLANGTYTFNIPAPNLAAQPLPALWGPTDNAAYMFACGDPLRPGTLYFTKGNQPDSAPQTNQLDMTSPSEPLVGGAIVAGVSLVMSTERGWLAYPNFSQATASVIGVSGSVFTTIETITERGLWCKDGICTDGGGNVYFIVKDGIRISAGGVGSESITDDDLYNLFPHEGIPQTVYSFGGIQVQPPDYTQPNAMQLSFSQGYVYFDYLGIASPSVPGSNRTTLKYHAARKAWSVDVYGVPASSHADNEGQGTSGINPLPALGVLIGCAEGSIRQLTGAPNVTENASVIVATPSYNGGGSARSIKHFGDMYIEYTQPTGAPAWTMLLYTNRYNVLQPGEFLDPPTLVANPSLSRTNTIVDIDDGRGVFDNDIALVLSAGIVSPGLSANGVDPVYQALYFWEPTVIEQPETVAQRFTDWLDGGTDRAKFIQGVIVHADSANVPKQIAIQSADDLTINPLSEMGAGVPFNVEQNKAFSLAAPIIAHRMRLVSLDSVPWRLWEVEWIFSIYPELCQEWHTPLTAHGLQGWQHVKEMNVEYSAPDPVTLKVVTDTGFIGASIVLPSTSGIVLKSLVTLPAFKGKMMAYNFSSTSSFRLWKEDLEVKVGMWGRPGSYQIVKPFGGPSSTEAQV